MRNEEKGFFILFYNFNAIFPLDKDTSFQFPR